MSEQRSEHSHSIIFLRRKLMRNHRNGHGVYKTIILFPIPCAWPIVSMHPLRLERVHKCYVHTKKNYWLLGYHSYLAGQEFEEVAYTCTDHDEMAGVCPQCNDGRSMCTDMHIYCAHSNCIRIIIFSPYTDIIHAASHLNMHPLEHARPLEHAPHGLNVLH